MADVDGARAEVVVLSGLLGVPSYLCGLLAVL